MFELRAPMMVKNDYTNVTMKCSVWQKDMDVIGSFAKKIGVPTPLFSATEPVYDAALKSGHGEHDTAAVCAVLEARAGVKRGKESGPAVRRVSLLRPSGGVSGSVFLG